MKVEELRAELEVKAKELGLIFNEGMSALVEEAAENDRRCHCDHDRRCPCDMIMSDVGLYGSCLCRVLVTQEWLDKRLKRQAAASKPRKKAKKQRKRPLTKAERKLIGRS